MAAVPAGQAGYARDASSAPLTYALRQHVVTAGQAKHPVAQQFLAGATHVIDFSDA